MTAAVPLLAGWASALLLAALDGRDRRVGWLAVLLGAGLLASLGLLAGAAARGADPSTVTGGWPAEAGIRLAADPLGLLFALVSVGLLVAVLAFEVAHGPRTRSFPALVLFLATGLTGLFLTGDLFNFYVFFELVMVSSFALAGYGGGGPESRAAAIFTVINLVGSVVFLGAVATVYRLTGTLELAAVARAAREAPDGAVLLVAALLLVAFGLKLGLFPFHAWLPAVYRETRPAVAAAFAGAVANVGSYGLIRFGGDLFPQAVSAGRPALLLLGGASILYGGLQAVHRRALPDVLAYSSIGQVGYTVVALAVGGPAGLTAAILYSLVNSLHKTGLFLGAGSAGAGVAGAFLVGGLSLAGLPPFAGFAGKAAVFRAGLDGGDWSWALLAVLAAGSALSFVYVLQA
ncbi:MAG TPA: proton-conducting transporter membrane subunit, partial [Thermoanaerobaculia bacterium]|nr:proton-conducting transporter membrane subunit [Thermoanaerobaculia bacterium]